jgi:hypothetical protein
MFATLAVYHMSHSTSPKVFKIFIMDFDKGIKDNLFKYSAYIKLVDEVKTMGNTIWTQENFNRPMWQVNFKEMRLNKNTLES